MCVIACDICMNVTLEFLLEEYDENMKLQWFVSIRYCETLDSLLCGGFVKERFCFGILTIQGRRIKIRWMQSMFDDHILQLYRLPTLLKTSDLSDNFDISATRQILTSHNETHSKYLYACQGLSTAIYGSHGAELIYAHIVNSPSFSTTDISVEIPFPRIQGLKVTGDANVCSGRYSFVIDIRQSIDPSIAIAGFEARSFQIVNADANGNYVAVNLRNERLHKIVGWYKGSGQINRDPNNPKYEWIDCHFVLYDNCNRSNQWSNSTTTDSSVPLDPAMTSVMYSIVWDDVDSLFHHMLDFNRPPNITKTSHYPFPVNQQQCGGLDWSVVPAAAAYEPS